MKHLFYIACILTNTVSAQTLHMKGISLEENCKSGATVMVSNLPYQLVVKTFKHDKVRLVTTVHYMGESALSDKQWAEKKGISLHKMNDDNISLSSLTGQQIFIALSSSQTNVNNYSRTLRLQTHSGQAFIYDSLGRNLRRPAPGAAEVTLYIPAGSKLVIKNAPMDVNIESMVKSVDVNINNSGLRMKDAVSATITANYGRVNTGNIKTADLKIFNSSLITGNIDNLKINSRSSDIEIPVVKEMQITSNNDQYEIDEVNQLSGNKQYGNLRIGLIKNSLELDGMNADVRVRNIKTSASVIRISNRSAEVRLPVSQLENYNVEFEGSFSNVYAPFNTNNDRFKTTVGDPKESGTSFLLKCNKCTIDFR